MRERCRQINRRGPCYTAAAPDDPDILKDVTVTSPDADKIFLQVDALACERDDRELFSGLSFSLAAGEMLQVAGENGAGKTTLLRMLSGLHGGYAGKIHWPAARQADQDPRQQMLFIGHRSGLRDELTALENLAWWCALHQQSLTGCEQALAGLGLRGFEDVPVSTLSAGQKRRVMLATLWLADKRVWLLDEPFTALDVGGVEQLEARMTDHCRQGGAVVYSSHHSLSAVARTIVLGRDTLYREAG